MPRDRGERERSGEREGARRKSLSPPLRLYDHEGRRVMYIMKREREVEVGGLMERKKERKKERRKERRKERKEGRKKERRKERKREREKETHRVDLTALFSFSPNP